MNKKKLTIEEQILHVKNKGITFRSISEESAKDFLENHSYFFKIKSYCKCFRKYTNKNYSKFGQYISLDFKQLVVFSKVDMEFRQALLLIILDIEHSLKVYLNRIISEDKNEDGYKVTKDFLQNNLRINKKISEILQHSFSNPYVFDMVKKYQNNFSSWNLVEILTFGDLISFYDFYSKRKSISNNFDFLLRYIKLVRNAAAHNNCMLNQLNPNGFKTTPDKRLKNLMREKISKVNSGRINKYLRVPALHDFAACIFGFEFIVKSESAKKRAVKKLQSLVSLIEENESIFCKELNLISDFDFIKNLINYFCSKNY